MLGFLAIARTTFDIPYAQEKTDALRAALREHFPSILEAEALITDSDGIQSAIRQFRNQPLDVLVVLQATFADSSVITALTDQIDAPLVLWSLPEPAVGGRLRLNSLCGINLAAFALRKRGRRFMPIYAEPTDPGALSRLTQIAKAGAALRALKSAAIGVVGEHPIGFEPCAYDESALRETFGVRLRRYDLDAAFAAADAVDAVRVDARYEALNQQLSNLAELNGAQVRGTLSFHEAMRDYVQADALGGLAVRCWPETFLKRDCAICASSSLFCDSGIPTTCEADVNGVVTGLIMGTISGDVTWGADLVAANAAANTTTFWHCGLAPLSMCDPEFAPRGALHSNRQRPLLLEFPLKPGRATVARLTSAGGSGAYRLAIGTGTMLRAPMQFTGTSGVFQPDASVSALLETIMREGLDHHYTITYGDHGPALRDFAALAGLEVINL